MGNKRPWQLLDWLRPSRSFSVVDLNTNSKMSLTARTLIKARNATAAQRRHFVDWMTNYPDKVRPTTIQHIGGVNQSKIGDAGGYNSSPFACWFDSYFVTNLMLFFLSSFDFYWIFIYFYWLQINELKQVHQAGGRAVFTWMKMPQDTYTNLFGAALMTFGMAQCTVGYWRLASGKGKIE